MQGKHVTDVCKRTNVFSHMRDPKQRRDSPAQAACAANTRSASEHTCRARLSSSNAFSPLSRLHLFEAEMRGSGWKIESQCKALNLLRATAASTASMASRAA